MRKLTGRIALPDGSMVAGEISFDSRIASIETSTSVANDYILPGLVDLQVNGSHGHDVMSADPDAINKISGRLAIEGTTAWLPTAITSPTETIERVHRAIGDAAASRSDGAAILGMHLEGPFISPKRLGAHPPMNLVPRGEVLERVMALEHLKLITLAPELTDAVQAIRRLTDRGVAVSIGHTDATLDEAHAGIKAGARMFTHLFNAMRPLGHRDPGVIAAALTPLGANPAVIPDAVHVHPEVLHIVYRLRRAEGMLFVTDKVSLACVEPSASMLIGRERARIERGAVRLSDGTIAGSIISMLDGLRIIVNQVGASIAEAARMGATNPAAMLGIRDRGLLSPGARADIIVLSGGLELKAVFVEGKELT